MLQHFAAERQVEAVVRKGDIGGGGEQFAYFDRFQSRSEISIAVTSYSEAKALQIIRSRILRR